MKNMESLNFNNIKKRQRVTILFRFIEFCILIVIISRFFTQLPLTFKLSTYYFKGLSLTLISPRFVFVLGNTIVIILFLKSRHSSAKYGSPSNIKIDLYDEYKQKSSMSGEAYCEQSKKQSILVQEAYCELSKKQSILVQEAYCEQSKKQRKQSILVERQIGKKIHRTHSDNSICLSYDEIKPRKELIRSATIGCREVINTDSVKSVEGEMSNEEFRRTVEAFIARQQRCLREEELFSAVVST